LRPSLLTLKGLFYFDTVEVTDSSSVGPTTLIVVALSRSGHHRAQDVVDSCRIALHVFPEPVVNVPIETGGNQHFG